MARQSRKTKRAAVSPSGKEKRKALKDPLVAGAAAGQQPELRTQLKSMLVRIGLPVAAVWVIGLLIAGFSLSSTVQWVGIGVPAVVTLLAGLLVAWALRQASKAKGVAGILSNVQTAEDRQAALEKLEGTYKKSDVAAVFARAQLQMQEDPDKALATLEQIDLRKVMAPVADEVRGQRAMIHLLKGQLGLARQLVDSIELKRHQEPRSRAMLAAIVAETWARSGQAKKGLELLALYDPEDDDFVQLRPQLYRAYACAYAHTSATGPLRRVLKRLLEQDPRLLGGFLMKRTHPLLQREAKKLLERSGAVPRKMIVQRRQ
ncbi:MAG: hypothetical protein JW940_14970 [Polyangiaceae bacterium]|nr:hypothetical protein [Polyangiaceae bacterium]